jgi:hypothetical protein
VNERRRFRLKQENFAMRSELILQIRHLRKSGFMNGKELLFWTHVKFDHAGGSKDTVACQFWFLAME